MTGLLRYIHAMLVSQGFSSVAYGQLMPVLSFNQKPGMKIPEYLCHHFLNHQDIIQHGVD